MLKIKVDYPKKSEEREILDRMASTTPNMEVNAVTTLKEIQDARMKVNDIYIDKIRDYIVNLISATRHPSEYKLKLISTYNLEPVLAPL